VLEFFLLSLIANAADGVIVTAVNTLGTIAARTSIAMKADGNFLLFFPSPV
jgi:hypothetical protein